MEHRLNHVISAYCTFCRGFFQEEHGFQNSKQIGALPRPQWLRFLESWRGCTESQSNRCLCGGARLCGNTTGSANAAFLSRWDHGRTASYPTAPVQIPACGTTARGSSRLLASHCRRQRHSVAQKLWHMRGFWSLNTFISSANPFQL